MDIKTSGSASGYEELANAIILLAVSDLKSVIRSSKRYSDRKERVMNHHVTEFFYSKDFRNLTSIDGDYIVKKLMREIWGDDH